MSSSRWALAPLTAVAALAASSALAQDIIDRHPERGLIPSESVSVLERPHPEWDPLGLRLGALEGDASLGLAAGYISNEKGVPDGSADGAFTVSPEVSLHTDWSRNQIAVLARSDTSVFSDASEDNATDYLAQITGRYDFARGTALEGGVSTEHVVLSRDLLDSPRDLIHPKQYDQQDAGLQLKTSAGPLQLAVGAEYERRDYSAQAGFNTIYDFNVQDLDRYTLLFTAAYPIGPRLGVYGNFEQQFRRYRQNDPILGSRDSDSKGFLIGAVYESPAFIRADVGFGYTFSDYSGANSGLTSDGLRLNASVEYFVTPLTTFTLTASRRSDVSEILTSPGRTTTNGALTVDHELLRNLIVSAAITGRLDEYDLTDRSDRYVGFQVGAEYHLNRRVSAGLQFAYLNVDTNRTIIDSSFDDVRVTASVRFHY